MSDRPRIIVTRRLPSRVEDALTARYDAVLNPDDHQFDATVLAQALRDADVVLCTLTDGLTRDVFESARPFRARLLANFGVGFDHIDVAAARAAGLAITNTPGVLTEDTADLTLLLMLAVARRTSEGERELRAGRWSGWRPTHLLGTRVSGASLGIVGFGRIGRAVARRAHRGFGMSVRYYSPRPAPPEIAAEVNAERVATVDELFARSDFVSLHTPATPETRHLVNAARLRLMKPTAFLVNTSRGEVVDEEALADALERRQLAGAALDVFEHEPAVSARLRDRDDVVLLPHLGSATTASREAMGMAALENIDAFVAGRPLPHRIA